MVFDHFDGAFDAIEDTAQLPELLEVADDFNAIVQLDDYFNDQMPRFEDMGDMDIIRTPEDLNEIVLGALEKMDRAKGALKAIGAELKFSPDYLAPYEAKLIAVMDEFESRSYRYFQEFMKVQEADSLVARGSLNLIVYDEEIHGERRRPRLTAEERKAHVSKMIELKGNLQLLKGKVGIFKEDFDALKDPDLSDPKDGDRICNNAYVAELLSRENHIDMFRVMYSYLESGALDTALDGDFSSEGLEEKMTLAHSFIDDVHAAEAGEEAKEKLLLAKLEQDIEQQG